MTGVRIGLSLVLIGAMGTGCDGDKPAEKAGDGTVLSPYLAIQDTLASDKLDKLPEMGANVIKATESIATEPGVDSIVQGAGRVGAQDIQTARTAFKKMSAGMIDYLKAHPDKQAGHVIVHCPMTFSGKGALWVQKEGKVMNPYEGAMMLHCGDKLDWAAELPKV